MTKYKKIAFLFPGQGAQFEGMGKDFYKKYPIARKTFDEADKILGRKLSKIIFNGPQDLLTETVNSQPAIYVVSIAILRVIQELYPNLKPQFCSGLSLGEYSALTAAGYLDFSPTLTLIDMRAQFMEDANRAHPGKMAVILGLPADVVEKLVKDLKLPNDIWTANFNCPGQVVIAGTSKGLEECTKAALEKGAKYVLPLQISGASHSGLMKDAEERLKEEFQDIPFNKSKIPLVMNVTGKAEKGVKEIKDNLIKQVTHPVRWEMGIRSMKADLFVEIGCGTILAGFNNRIFLSDSPKTISISSVPDLKQLDEIT